MSQQTINILDLVSRSRLQNFQNAFSKFNKVAIVMLDLYGKPITEPSGFCKLCRLIRSTEQGELDCRKNDRSVAKKSSSTGQYAIEKCERTGFADATAPLIVRGQKLASWGIGQANIEGNVSDEHIRRYAQKIGVDPYEAVVAFQEKKQEVMSMKQFEKIIENLLEYCQPIITSAEISLITGVTSSD